MKKIKRFIQKYYTRELYTQEIYDFFVLCLLFICGLSLGLLLLTSNKPFSDDYDELVYVMIGVTSVVLLVLNYFGKRGLNGPRRNLWLKIPYISSLYIVFLYWFRQIFSADISDRNLVIVFPIVFPILSWGFQFILMDRLLKPEQAKVKALLLSIPIVITSILGFIFVTAEVFIIQDSNTTYSSIFVLGFLNLTVPPYFTATSEYWHPELRQPRHDEAIGTLKQTKKSKKTGKKKKKLNLKK